MNFFHDEMQKHGLEATFERFVFSHEANWGTDKPRMLDHFLAGLVHSFIHFGHAAEFGVLGMAVEGITFTSGDCFDLTDILFKGLAQAAVHAINYPKLFDEKFFDHPFETDSVDSLLPLTSNQPFSSAKTKSQPRIHIFTILGRIFADPRLAAGQACSFETYPKFFDTINNAGNIIREYAEQWTVGTEEEEIQQRVEELTWFVTAAFGIGGWKKDRQFKADFWL